MIEIDNLIKDALKNKHIVELKVYRNLKADIIAFKTQKNAPEYNEASEISIIRKYAIKMEDAEKQYSQAGREDLMLECREELEVLKKLLPEPVSLEKIYFTIEEHCQKYGWLKDGELAIPKKEMGKLIKLLKKNYLMQIQS
jgi:uncharacterized protein YqeY